jgi:hypothetical protein
MRLGLTCLHEFAYGFRSSARGIEKICFHFL